jgi:hypothetical protein
MKIKDNCLYFSTEGQQLNFSIMLCIVASIGFFVMDSFEKALGENLVFSVLKGVFAVGALYLLFYSVFLSKRLTEKYYK